MKTIWKYLSNHLRTDFHTYQYLFILIFLCISITINYQLDFSDRYLDPLKGFQRFYFRFLFFAFAYYATASIVALTKKENNFFSRRQFWIKSLLAISLLSLDSSLPFLRGWIDGLVNHRLHLWAYKVGVNLISLFTILLPLLAFYRFYDANQKHWYGLRWHNFDPRPYLQMLLIMLPLLTVASFNAAFQRQYPMYKTSAAHIFLDVPEWVTVVIYEMAYGLDFVTVEMLFRGFMIIGMITVMGRDAVLPMVVTYCFLHFGKPAGEAISSVAGGYVLGVVALETRSIWGGIIVHVGIAWTMEMIAYLQEIIAGNSP